MNIKQLLVGFLLLGSTTAFAQKDITLEDIWAKPTFRQKSIQNLNWSQDGQSYLELKEGKIIKYNIVDPSKTETLFDEAILKTSTGGTIRVQQFSLSADEQTILIGTSSEAIYRRSSKETNYIFLGQTIPFVCYRKAGNKCMQLYHQMENV